MSKSPLNRTNTGASSSPILRETTRWLMPVFFLFSIFLLLRGHHLPGGGFAGGLVAAAGVCFAGVVHGEETLRRILGMNIRLYIGLGLIIAIAAAIWPVLIGQPFFTGLWTVIPVIQAKVGTPLLFDVGVYLMVVGATCGFIDGLIPTDETAQEEKA